jgi:hypothetical protein
LRIRVHYHCSTPCLMHSSVLILLIPSHPCKCSWNSFPMSPFVPILVGIQVSDTLELLHWMQCEGVEPDRHVLSWNTVFRGSAMHWCGREALWHFEQMHEEHVETGIAWLSLLVCERIAKVLKGCALLWVCRLNLQYISATVEH